MAGVFGAKQMNAAAPTVGICPADRAPFVELTESGICKNYPIQNQLPPPPAADVPPTLPVINSEAVERIRALTDEIAALEASMKGVNPAMEEEKATWEAKLKQKVTWEPLDLISLDAGTNAVWEKQTDNSILVVSGVPQKATFKVKMTTPLRGITAFRLEALPDDTLPNRGPGHSPNGNAVVNEIIISAAQTKPVQPKARYVRINADGKGRILHLAEVEVHSAGQNIAPKGTATQSSTDFAGVAQRAIDGNTDGNFESNSTTHTSASDNPWWEVDLGSEVPLEQIIIWNRTDSGTADRLASFAIVAMNERRESVWEQQCASAPMPSHTVKLSEHRQTLKVAHATATYSQKGWHVSRAIDGNPKTGWAFSPLAGERHAAVFELTAPLDFGEGTDTTLDITLVQEFGDDHTLGRFRLTATTSPTPVVALSETARTILAKPRAERNASESNILNEIFRPSSKVIAQLNSQIAQKRKELATVRTSTNPTLPKLTRE